MNAEQIIAELGGRAAVADALGRPVNTVVYWERRGRIPSRYWPKIVDLASGRDQCGVTAETLISHDRSAAA